MKKLLFTLLAFCALVQSASAQQYIDPRIIPPEIMRDNELIPTGETNAICLSGTATPTPSITLCSTLNLTGKTVLMKLPEYTVATLPASHPLAIVTDGNSATDCTTGTGATRVMCHWNGSAWAAIGGGGGVGDPGSNGIAVRSALNTLIARTITGTEGTVTVTNGDGVAGNPTLTTGNNVPLLNGTNVFTATNSFTSKLIAPLKATPGDLGLLTNGEVFIDGELVKYKSNTGTVYALFKIGDPIVRSSSHTVDPGPTDDSLLGYIVGDLWISTQNTASPDDDTVFVAAALDVGAAKWINIGTGGTTPSWQQVMDIGRIVEADCSNPVKIAKQGDPTTYFKICHDTTDGPQFVPVIAGVENAANKRVKLSDTFDWCILDSDNICLFKLTEAGVFSGSAIKKTVEVVPFDFTTDVATGDGKFYFRVPTTIDGYSLSNVKTNVITAGTTNATTIGIDRCAAATTGNVCSGTVTDMLATGYSIDSGENSSSDAATPGALSATPANLIVTAGQIIRINVDSTSTTPAKGLIAELEFTAP